MDGNLLQDLMPILTVALSGALVIIGNIVTYRLGKAKNAAELEKLRSERNNMEAATGLSTAEAASILSQAAADIVQPLTVRIKELQSEVAKLTTENAQLKNKVTELEAKVSLVEKQKEIIGEDFPYIPS